MTIKLDKVPELIRAVREYLPTITMRYEWHYDHNSAIDLIEKSEAIRAERKAFQKLHKVLSEVESD